MRELYFVALLLTTACGPDTFPQTTQQQEEVWVCHNPESNLHGMPCRLESSDSKGEYEACHWIMDESSDPTARYIENSFCWLLEATDCSSIEFEWQRQSCHLLGY